MARFSLSLSHYHRLTQENVRKGPVVPEIPDPCHCTLLVLCGAISNCREGGDDRSEAFFFFF